MFGGNGINTSIKLKESIQKYIKPIMENWSNTLLSNHIIVYGIRRYLRGAWLSLHVDKGKTHVLSAILQASVNKPILKIF